MSFPPIVGQVTIPVEASPVMAASLIARFLAKIELSEGCWRWTSTMNGVDYGVISVNRNGKRLLAHRIAYELWNGPIPSDLVLDHLCRNPSCVNPAHLEAVTMRENILRGTSPSAQQARQTHCGKGHPLNGENLHIDTQGRRRCVICTKVKIQTWWATTTADQRERWNAQRRKRYADRKARR